MGENKKVTLRNKFKLTATWHEKFVDYRCLLQQCEKEWKVNEDKPEIKIILVNNIVVLIGKYLV